MVTSLDEDAREMGADDTGEGSLVTEGVSPGVLIVVPGAVVDVPRVLAMENKDEDVSVRKRPKSRLAPDEAAVAVGAIAVAVAGVGG